MKEHFCQLVPTVSHSLNAYDGMSDAYSWILERIKTNWWFLNACVSRRVEYTDYGTMEQNEYAMNAMWMNSLGESTHCH